MTSGDNLVLIGMPGCGKSTVGVLAAKALGLDFIDTDLLLQTQEGCRLAELLARRGRAGFLAAEGRLLASLSVRSTLVATGGSAVYHEGMAALRAGGTVVWLDVEFDELERRLVDVAERGVVLAPRQTLRALYDERRPLYEQFAHLRLDVGREDLETTVVRLTKLRGLGR